MATTGTILLVDDETALRNALAETLKDAGHRTRVASDGATCMKELEAGDVAVVLLDVWLRPSNENGLHLLPAIVREHPEVRVIMLTALGDADDIVTAMKNGAYNYVVKGGADLATTVREKVAEALDDPGRERQVEAARVTASARMVAESPKMKELLQQVRMAARSAIDITVLIRGETGAGKDVIARELHYLSAHSDGPFVAVDTAAVHETLMESELFGHERGAFTGAASMRKGLAETAENGTLFLDEIGDLSADMQGKLLRVLESKHFRRLGSSTEIPLRARVVAATWRDLKQSVQQGTLRPDLYHRLAVAQLFVPPLRERPEDILAIAREHLRQHSVKMNQPARALEPDTEAAFLSYAWPGNVRELRNALDHALIFSEGPIRPQDVMIDFHAAPVYLTSANAVHTTHVAAAPQADAAGPIAGAPSILSERSRLGRPLTMVEGERLLIEDALRFTNMNKTKAATVLGFARATLQRKIREYKIEAD